ncbi:tail length tape measure protein [Streptomyces phage Thestral]|uniref:Tape measure protein n=1 Tax=Streptomyces phage Thestral TaxID=2301715 RepID=A0A385E0E8_9CAUD|nr:tail length tape measure protein [Streptomyces phage Thestral]AXQ65216.1 tape measure protein [Streptomyces phage Thestral]
MPAGQVIGRVSVRVLPDTSEFRRKAQKDLDRIENQLEVKVELKPVMGNFVSDMLKEIRKVNQQNRSMDSRKVRIYTTIARSNIPEELRKAIRRYEDVAKSEKVKLKTTLDTTDIDVKISDSSLRDMTDQLKDWRDRNSPLKIKIEPDVAASSSAATSARLGILTRPRTVSIIPELNNAAVAKVAASLAALSGVRVLNNLFTKFSNILRNLDKNVPIIGSLATAVAGLAAWGISATSNLFALSASLAQIGATALTLPGILGGFAVGIGVTVAALKDFNKEVPEVKSALSEIQNAISANFWEQARKPIRELVDDLLPRFAKGFKSSATEIGKFFGSFATDLTAALDPGLVDKMFGYLNESITTATGGTKTFASIIAQLGEVGASYLPDLAGWFVNISKEFDTWLKKKGELGLKAEIDQGITALKDLGGILVETGGILAGVSRAANEAGGSSLGMLRDTLAQIHTVVDSEGFQNGLVGVFEAAHRAMSNLANGAGPAVKNLFVELSELLTTVLPQAGSIIGVAMGAIADALAQPAVTEGVKAVFTGLYQAVQALAPMMAPLGQALGAIMQVVAAMLPVFAGLVTAAVVPLANAFAELAPQIIPIVELLGGALTSAFQVIGPLIQQLVPVVGEMLGAAFGLLAAILPPIAELFTMIMQAVAPLIEQLVGALAPILPVLGEALAQIFAALQPVVEIALQILTAVIEPLLPMLSEVIQAVLPPLADAITRVVEALQPFLQALLAVVDFIMPILVPIIQFLIEILAGALVAAINGVGLVLEGLKEFFVGVWDYIVGYFKMIWGIFEGIFTGNWDTFEEGFDQLWEGIKGIFKGAWDIIIGALEVFLNVGILGTAGKAFKAIGQFFKSAWKSIATIFTDAFNAIRGYIGVFFTGAGRLVTDGLASIGRFFSSAWSSIRTAASGALSKLVSTVGEWIGKAVTTLKELPGKAKSALGSLGSTLIEAGKSLIKGLIKGISSMFGAVKDKLGSLTSKLTDWKGPESLDRVLLVGAGQLVINGFIKGLESRYDAVRKSLAGLTDDVASTEFDVPGVNAIGVSGGVSGAVTAGLAGSTGGGTTKVLNYYAAPGSSLGSEEDLFAAANRARFGW